MAKPHVARSLLLLVPWLTAACTRGHDGAGRDAQAPAPVAGRLFTELPATYTGVDFRNDLHETRDRNVFTYRNYYNGGGVAIADLTGDGLPEIVLTSNEEGPRLYLNRGHFRFTDVTDEAKLSSAKGSWTTGVTIADVNGDGKLDIYICKAGPGDPASRANELWINQGLDRDGVPTFKEMGKEYGVADEGWSTQAVFFDYDGDGDLDLFVLDNSPKPATSFGLINRRNTHFPYAGGHLYRNDGGHFTDVSEGAGIHGPEVAFGLGVVVADVNNDGWPDIYVSNDFFERDYLYVNRGDGTFSEALDTQMPAVSYFSMGLDVADVDNDGWPDVYTTDMLPSTEYRTKTTTRFESWNEYRAKIEHGYHRQLMRNMLQRNNRDGTFTDVGEMAGVAATDWSWAALIADFDLDGRKDLFVTNGLAKDITSQDYVAFLGSEQTMREVTNNGRDKADFGRLTKAMESTRLENYAFHNDGALHFSSVARQWGLATPSFSSGAAYGDLDGDGAPDLVVNNVDGPAFVYRNDARKADPGNHYLRVRLDGSGANRFALGARVTAYAGSDAYMQEESPTRGFQSSVDYVLEFGLGAHAAIDSLRVDWPDGAVTVARQVAANRLLTLKQSEATKRARPPARPALAPKGVTPTGAPTLVADLTDSVVIPFRHTEEKFVDFEREPLIPKMLSTEGPTIAVADVNGDGLDDMYIGGAKGQPGALLVQQADGSFASVDQPVFAPDAISEDVGAVFFDANGDGKPDLYVVSGGSEYSDGAPALQDRLYLNDGRGHFHKAVGALPAEGNDGSRVVAADFDHDGDVDLFVGGREVPWQYGIDPPSMLLANDGKGHFTDVTAKLAPELQHVGMVTDAVWKDLDGDGWPELIVVGEWMPITIFHNDHGKLRKMAVPGLEQSNGWWNRIIAGDFTGHGRVDFIVGNLGLNGALHASASEPVRLYAKDFDGSGVISQILTTYRDGKSYPWPLRDNLLAAAPSLRPRFPTYKDYAGKTMDEVFPPESMRDAVVKTADTFASVLVRNDGGGKFTVIPLPDEAQIAPVYGLLATDVDGDGHTDVLLAGNFEGFEPQIGAMMSGRGLLLRGDGKGTFTPVLAPESGFVVPGQARDIQRLRTRRGDVYVVAMNNDRPLVFRPQRGAGKRTPAASTVAARRGPAAARGGAAGGANR